MHRFTFHRPATLDEARADFADHADVLFLAGGHTVIPAMKNRLLECERLVDVRNIADLKGIALEGGYLSVGAATPHAQVASTPEVQDAIPALAGLAGSIGDRQVRNMGTIGGSLANNDPAADYPAAVLALAAEVVTDRRTIPADAFFVGMFATALEEGEIIVRVRFPIPRHAAYAKLRSAASRYAIAGVFVAVLDDGAVRVAVTGAGAEGVFRANDIEAALGRTFDPAALEDVQIDVDGLLSDANASADFRAHLIVVLARRAVTGPGPLHVLS